MKSIDILAEIDVKFNSDGLALELAKLYKISRKIMYNLVGKKEKYEKYIFNYHEGIA